MSPKLTLTSGWMAMWHAGFYTSSLAESSATAAALLTPRDAPDLPRVPFSMLATLAISMAVPRLSESAKFHLGTFHASQHAHTVVGETVRCSYRVMDLWRDSSRNVVVDTVHTSVHGSPTGAPSTTQPLRRCTCTSHACTDGGARANLDLAG